MRYGLPYKGSKNAIAKWIVEQLPKAETFVDLFCGGGAVTHSAMLSGKYKRFIMNDIDGRLPKLFIECVQGKHKVENHPEWISREEFHAKKNEDALIALLWSFGNNGVDYLYGESVEGKKHALHKAVYFNDFDDLRAYGYKLTQSNAKSVYKRYLDYCGQLKSQNFSCELESLERLERLQSLERLERLQSLERLERLQSLERLERLQSDYKDVDIPKDSVIYCDIPYNNTSCGKYQGFNHERFYKWAMEQDNIFISEYEMPEGFIPFSCIDKRIHCTGNTTRYKKRETIFTNERTFYNLNKKQQEMQRWNFAEQLSIYDIGIGG